MSYPRSVHSFDKLLDVCFSGTPCVLPLGDKDEIKQELSCCCSSCPLGHLCIFTHKSFSFKKFVCNLEGYLSFESFFFLLLVSFVCLYGKTKKFIFAAKAFSPGPIRWLMQIYLVKLNVGLGHDVLKILLPTCIP